MVLIGLLIAGAAPAQEVVPTPGLCRVAAGKVAARLLIGRGVLDRQDAKGVPPEQKARRDRLAAGLAEGEAKVRAVDARYRDAASSDADVATFDAMPLPRQKALLDACAA